MQITAWIHFDRPILLLCLILAAVPAVSAHLARSRGRRRAHLPVVLQTIAAVLLVAAMAGPSIPTGAVKDAKWILLKDISLSTGRQAGNKILLGDNVAIIPFAEQILSENQLPSKNNPATNISGPLDLAAGRIKTAAGVLILTDGRFDDNWQQAASRLALANKEEKPVIIVPLDRPDRDARITSFKARREGSTCRLILSIATNAILKPKITISRADRDKKIVFSKTMKVFSDHPLTVRATDEAPAGEFASWKAVVEETEGIEGNNIAFAGITGNRQVVAYVSSAAYDDALPKETGMKTVLLSPKECPAKTENWSDYSAVVLVDPTGTLLDSAQRKALADYVRAGGGLVLLGSGPRQFPSDRQDPVNRIAALVPNPFERNPLSLVIVLDASGSMAEKLAESGTRKFDIASEAAISLKDHLTPSDKMRVIVFSDTAREIYDSNQSAINFPTVAAALRRVEPSGPTNVAPALELASQSTPAKKTTGLVMVLSDLETKEFDVDQTAGQFTKNGWKIAVVAEGSAPSTDSPLSILADKLRGVTDTSMELTSLDRIFAGLCRKARGDGTRKGGHAIQSPASGILSSFGSDFTLIETAATPGADVICRVAPSGDPLLGVKRAGLGSCMVLAALPPPAENGKLPPVQDLAKMVRRVAKPPGDNRFTARLINKDGRPGIEVDAAEDGKPLNHQKLVAEIVDIESTDSKPMTVPMIPAGVGLYKANIPENISAPAVTIRLSDSRIVSQVPPSGKIANEFANTGADYETLRQLANITGGKIQSLDDLIRVGLPKSTATTGVPLELWPWLILIAIVLVLAQWLMRK